MAEQNDVWEDCCANVGNCEVCKGRFVTFTHVTSGQPHSVRAIDDDGDYAPQRTLEKPEAELHLIHDTKADNIQEIIECRGFRGGQPRIRQLTIIEDPKVTLSWWAVGKPDDWSNWDGFRVTGVEPKDFSPSYKSPTESRYGNKRYRYGLTDLLASYRAMCEEYSNNNNDDTMKGEISFRKFGTFRYPRREVMYAVLVCPKGCPHFRDFPTAEISPDGLTYDPDKGPIFGYYADKQSTQKSDREENDTSDETQKPDKENDTSDETQKPDNKEHNTSDETQKPDNKENDTTDETQKSDNEEIENNEAEKYDNKEKGNDHTGTQGQTEAAEPQAEPHRTWIYRPSCFAIWGDKLPTEKKLRHDNASFAFYLPKGYILKPSDGAANHKVVNYVRFWD